MKIREFQEYVKDRLNAVESLVQGGCKAIAEDTLDVATEIETQLQTAAGVAIVVTTPNFKRNGCAAGGISVDTLLAVKCVEQVATNREAQGHLTALDAGEIVMHELDGNNIGFVDIAQTADQRAGTVIATVNFNVAINLS